MQILDDRPETIHLYVIRDEDVHPQYFPIILSVLALLTLVAFCSLTPYRQPVTRISLRVSAVPLYLKDFQASVQIVPTGVKTYPATTAHGVLTFSNGSIIGQSIPVGYVIDGAVTDRALYVPPATVDGFGMATVPAHLLTSGINMSTLSINEVIGSSLFVRNLSPSYSVKVITPQDIQTAFTKAPITLAIHLTGLHDPCKEDHFIKSNYMTVTLHCQFLTYSAPTYLHIISVKLSGKEVLISGWFIPPLKRFWVK